MPKIPACQSGKGSVPWGTRTQRGFGMTGLFQVRLDGHFLISRVLWVEFQVKSSSATTVRLRLQVAGWLLPAMDSSRVLPCVFRRNSTSYPKVNAGKLRGRTIVGCALESSQQCWCPSAQPSTSALNRPSQPAWRLLHNRGYPHRLYSRYLHRDLQNVG